MKVCIFLALLVTIAYSNVVDLTPENFDQVVDGSKHAFVEFFAPWCGHCKSLAPAYEELGAAFAKEADVVIAKVDADAHKELGSKFGVSGFPTLKFFKKGSTTPEDYNGGREAPDMLNWINQQTGSRARIAKPASAVTVLDPSNFDSVVLDKSKHAFVEFYAPWCGHCKRLTPIWEKLASAFKNEDEVVIANLDADAHKDLATKFGVSGFPTIIFFSKDNKEGDRYNGGRELADLVKHVNEKAGTKRLESGHYDDTVGRFESLDKLAREFLSSPEKRDSIVAETVKEEDTLASKQTGHWYSKFMNVIAKRGADFVTSELARVKALLDGGSLSGEKIDEFTVRQNILNAFTSA